jgi:peptidoglycan/LPS O-acetylase OafA/YrhL
MTQVLFNLTMIQTFFHVPDIDGVYWTLQVELIFYALMLGLWRVGALARPVPMLSAWVALSLVTGWSDVPYLLSTVLMLDWIPWFVLGIVSYLASASQRFTAPLLFLAGIAVLSISVRSGIALAALGSSFTVVVWMAALGRIRILGSRPVVALGAISYPLYLLHEKIGFATIRQVEEWTDSPILAICAATLVCVVLAAVVHQTIEVRATRAIRSWYGKPRSGQTIPGHRLT